ncbi:MAG: DUF151 domain-containing protein [Corynebacterium sp.]|nr:DUF151 domain-containing protein [Corynebacterium sp.]
MGFIELSVDGVYRAEVENFNAIFLRSVHNPEWVLPLWVTEHMAGLVEDRLNDRSPRRPDCYELLADAWCVLVKEVAIISYYDGLCLADIVFNDEKRTDAKPSDAVLLAMHLRVPIMIDEDTFHKIAIFAGTASVPELFENGPSVGEPEYIDIDGFLNELFGSGDDNGLGDNPDGNRSDT